MSLNTFLSAELNNKKVLLRVDYNVPLQAGKITDDNRIRESLPTLKRLLEMNAKVIIMSHLGRPDGSRKQEFSLKPTAIRLQKLLGRKVKFLGDCLGAEVEEAIAQMKPRDIIMLENLRFYAEEEKNDVAFSRKLSQLGEIYIDDAFGCAHRAHASITGISKHLPSFAGLLLQKEFEHLTNDLKPLRYPVTMIIGGAKIDTKIGLIKNFAGRVDHFILGGGIANTFLAAKKHHLGSSLIQKDQLKTALQLEAAIRRKNKNLHLPEDYVVARKIGSFVLTKNVNLTNMPADRMILDIGSKSAKKMAALISKSKTIIWNGPVGVYEYRPFRNGTRQIARAVVFATKHGATSIVGGGDTVDAIRVLGYKHSDFTHVSTGGGAMLELLEKGSLPGIDVLMGS